LDLTPRSFAPDELISRLLDEFVRVGLTDQQLHALLRVQAVYRRVQRGLGTKMALIVGQLRVNPERLTPAGRAQRLRLHHSYGSLITQQGVNADTALGAVFELLTREQLRRLGAAYMADVDEVLQTLGPVLAAAVAPTYALGTDTKDGLREFDPGPSEEFGVADADRLDLALAAVIQPAGEAERGLPVLQGQA
jgi:hypothetical protein